MTNRHITSIYDWEVVIRQRQAGKTPKTQTGEEAGRRSRRAGQFERDTILNMRLFKRRIHGGIGDNFWQRSETSR